MINIRDNNFITQISEMTVEQFSKATSIFNDDSKLNIEKYLEVIEALGTSSEVIDSLTNEELFEIIADFSKETKIFNADAELPRTITCKGWTYEAYSEGEEFKIKARDLALIEKAISKREDFYQTLLSILFKDPSLVNETYNKSHLEYKKSLFSTLPAQPYLKYLLEVSTIISTKVNNAFRTPARTA